MPFEFVYNKGLKPVVGIAENSLNNIGRVNNSLVGAVEGVGRGVQGIGDFFAGDSNIMLYLVVGVVGVAVLPTLLNKLL